MGDSRFFLRAHDPVMTNEYDLFSSCGDFMRHKSVDAMSVTATY